MQSVTGVVFDCTKSANDYPRGYKVELSKDGSTWDKPVLPGLGNSSVTELMLPKPAKTKFIRITQTGETKGTFWSIHELQVLKPAAKLAGK